MHVSIFHTHAHVISYLLNIKIDSTRPKSMMPNKIEENIHSTSAGGGLGEEKEEIVTVLI